jgi:hypothetical protein
MKQLSIITENYFGVITEISEAMASAKVNIESLDAELVGDHVVIVLMADPYDLALQVIHQFSNMQVVTEDAILVKLVNEPGALAKIARRFTDAGVGLRSVRFIQRDAEFALVAISTDRTDKALGLVTDVLVS